MLFRILGSAIPHSLHGIEHLAVLPEPARTDMTLSIALPHMLAPLFVHSQVLCESPSVKIGVTATQADATEQFMDAVRAGNSTQVELLIRSGTDLRKPDAEGWTCLHWATELGHEKLVLRLLDGCPLLLNMKTNEGLSAINIAAWQGNKRMVELLISQGAEIDDVTKWGEAPLHHAVTFGHASVCEALLSAGANPFHEDKLKRTPYSIAMQRGSPEVKKVFQRYTPPKP